MRIFLFTAALLVSLPVSLPAKPLTIKFSHVVAKDTPKGHAVEHFKQLVEERSNGRLLVRIYPNSTLYDDRAALKALERNTIQLAAPSFSKFIDYAPELQLFDLPFLFRDRQHLHRVLDGEAGQTLLQTANRRGLHALAFWDNGFKQLTANKPLIRPEDAKGLKFRIMSSKVLESQFLALEANPQVLPFSEVYSALQQGLVSGEENTLSNIYTKNLYRVQSDLTLSNHGYLGYLVVTNELFWQKLPADLKRIISDAIMETTLFTRETSRQVNARYLEKIETEGRMRIHRLSPAQRQAWKEKMAVVYAQFYGLIGEELIRKVQE